MAADLGTLRTNLTRLFGDKLVGVEERLGELTVVVKAADMLDVLTAPARCDRIALRANDRSVRGRLLHLRQRCFRGGRLFRI